MEKRKVLKCVNWSLVVLLLCAAVSSVILECLGGGGAAGFSGASLVMLHFAVTVLLMLLLYFHIKLHFGAVGRWGQFLGKTKKTNRWLFWTCVLTFVTGVAATVAYFSHGHTPLGGIHGKIGFAALIFMAGHLLHRVKRL